MMQQYFDIKNQYADFLLFYRIGDFYELFYDDAIVGSRVLDLTLTGKLCGEEERAPMCGIPFHAADLYIGKLIEKGYKVAVCEQTEDPSLAKGLVKREVIRTVTPGTIIEAGILPEQKNNYLCAIDFEERAIGVCFADASTAQVYATSFDGANREEKVKNELAVYCPAEIVLNINRKNAGVLCAYFDKTEGLSVNDNQSRRFDADEGRALIERVFDGQMSEEAFSHRELVGAVGGLLNYLAETEMNDLSYLKTLTVYAGSQFMEMDANTRRNLELVETMRTKEKKGSLLWVLDKTKTASGARMMRKWVESPLVKINDIQKRQGAVAELTENYMLREQLGETLSHVLDLERLSTRIVFGTAHAKDLRAVGNTASVLPEIKKLIATCQSDELKRIFTELDTLDDVAERIGRALVEEPPFSVREGGMIAPGYNADVDRYRDVMANGKTYLDNIAESERERTGIKNLKVAYNRVFGYYIEVTHSFLDLVPDNYIRKQTLTGAERFITPELKELENTILGAEEKVVALEYNLFCELRDYVGAQVHRLQKTAELLATLDCYLSLGTVASKNHYVCPEMVHGDTIDIKDGRHPVVELFVKDSYFVPNDTHLDTENERLMLITGPNMAGKSTFMRQVALITVMAQIGSFVPAKEATLGVVDKVFTRVGASDDLASGESTFMLEMNEVSYILKNATKRSLIIYDEVGRGTSTYDGMSIARAIIEFTAGKKIGAKTLFATHYHELTALEGRVEGIVNYNIAAKKRGDGIIFLRKILRGGTDDSYGIEVAKLAGLPDEVIRRAKEVLSSVEATAQNIKNMEPEIKTAKSDNVSLTDCLNEAVIAELKAVDLNALSPFECMSFLFDLKKKLE